MNTPPDGQSPRMQMYLFAGASVPSVNGGDEASIVYHEYTHGLSNRLVTDGSGVGALNTAQAGAMGEAWSDWYALDFLVSRGLRHRQRRHAQRGQDRRVRRQPARTLSATRGSTAR